MDMGKRSSVKRGWLIFGYTVWATFKWLVIFGIITGMFVGGAVTGYVASLVKDEPVRPRSYIESKIGEYDVTGYVYFNDDTPIGQLRTEEDRQLVQFDEIPQVVIDAVLAIEDDDFFKHPGVDIWALGRAIKQKVLNEDTQTGGSTLTQQLARRVFLSLEVTDSRKVREIFLALRLERFLSKQEILTAYLNKVPFGNGSSGYNLYGIKAAAKGIFGIDDLHDLNLAQAAFLAGLPQRPSAYSVFTSKGEYNEKGIELAINRQKLVLRRMLETGRITKQEYEEALAFDIRASFAKPEKKAYNTYPYLMLEAERQAVKILLELENPELKEHSPEYAYRFEEKREELLRGGYHIYTTIDKEVYDLMRKIASDPNNFSPDHEEKGMEQVAAMMIDHKTGAILGMIEGRDFYEEQMNFATQMTRQPGSTMKTIAAYLPAIEMGLVQPASILDDAPIVLKDGQKGFHLPKNSGGNSSHGGYNGLVTAREALNRSLNLPALKIFLEKVTIPKAWEFVRKLGITTLQPEDDYAQTGVIGGLSRGVTVEELTNAYGAIPNGGVFHDAFLIRKITDSNGKVIYEHKPRPVQVFSERTAFLVTDMLRTVITNGTGSVVRREYANKEIPIAGKTGSTQSYGDVWFIGFTPDITLGVWAGYEKPIHTLTGDARYRAQHIWAKIMNEVTQARPDLFPTKEFPQPEGVVKATVSGVSGKRPTELTRAYGKLVTDWFNEDYLPKESEDGLVKMRVVEYKGVLYIPQPTTPEDFIREKVLIVREKPLDELMEEIEAAMAKMPASSRKPLSYFLPKDAALSAPSKVDPRVDDGRNPSPPTGLKVEEVDDMSAVRITFKGSPEEDVVGYRLYRSLNGGPFVKTGESIYHGNNLRFVNYVSPSYRYSYYVTAVDVAGRESAPSAIVTWGGGSPGQSEMPYGPQTPPFLPQDPQQTPQDPAQVPQHQEPVPDGGTAQEPYGAEPSAPRGLAVERTDIGFSVSWNPNPDAERVEKYRIYFSEDGNRFRRIGEVNANRFEYVSPLASGFIRITAVNEYGESPASESVALPSP
ncbi:MAG: carboxypeptidase [Thermobacillus sp. ZCTH02-B1]|uniref:transglycosylase domain-containing protein n=1 Tax=Thermobacillus sp. ZCTH02-B1 TaxID=1858795 RepID=UPI000B56D986|nr:transglycosylase domain-containing protein [Thermobacillus sp. ZCTH02-B1]OUM96465.1 MAG: carboxypeptidase [Thermobacillus sp. ZCTH02-B1]